jgi:hypothetical protein
MFIYRLIPGSFPLKFVNRENTAYHIFAIEKLSLTMNNTHVKCIDLVHRLTKTQIDISITKQTQEDKSSRENFTNGWKIQISTKTTNYTRQQPDLQHI